MKKIILLVCVALSVINTTMAQETNDEFISNGRQLIYEGVRSGEGYFNSDGSKMVFQAERDSENPFYQIFMLDFETGKIEQVSTGIGKTTCTFFNWANDKDVLYGSTHHDKAAMDKQQAELDFRASGKKRRYTWDYDPEMDLFSKDINTGKLTQLTTAKGYDAEAAYSPDGKYIVFSSTRSGYKDDLSEKELKTLEYNPSFFGEIYIMNSDGSNIRQLTDKNGYDGGPFFSPDSKRIVWRSFNDKGDIADVYTMAIDGSDVQRVTDFSSMSWAPYYHSSMEYIIFASNKLGYSNFELYIADVSGLKEPVRVSFTDGFDGLPVFSPSGNELSWTSTNTSDGKAHVFYGNWNHEKALQALKNAPLKNTQTEGISTPKIELQELTYKVSVLANDSLEGRMTGGKGIKKASAFIQNNFKEIGVEPLTGIEGYTQEFSFISELKVDEAATLISFSTGKKSNTLELYADYLPSIFSDNGEVSGNIVYVGYGIKTPTETDVMINDYAGLDVKDKIVLIEKGEPEGLTDEERKSIIQYSGLRYKALTARQMGAKAIIFIHPYDVDFKPLSQHFSASDMGIISVTADPGAVKTLLNKTGFTLEKLKEQHNSYNMHSEDTRTYPEVTINIKVQLDKVYANDDNIIGFLPAVNSDEYLIIGGHYDHLGKGETSSRASDDELHDIHNGADDNASGTATVMELAEYYAALTPEERTINMIFVLWAGEELGLVGSKYFTKNSPIDLSKVKAYLNFDMVGRLRDNTLILQGLGSSENWKQMIERLNVKAGFQLKLQSDPYVPTDAMALYLAKVPILCFFTGITDEYHTPADDIETVDFEGMKRIADFAQRVVENVASTEMALPYKEVDMSATQGSSKGFSVYLGTIPDYGADVDGVKLSGVRKGGPAEKAGLQKDDIIISLAGKEITNIYDYTYILGDMKPNVTVKMIIKRGEEELTLKITPKAK